MMVSLVQFEDRLTICKSCDGFVEQDPNNSTRVRCRARGGNDKKCDKTWAHLDEISGSYQCPVGKWPSIQLSGENTPTFGWPCPDPGEPPEYSGPKFEQWMKDLSNQYGEAIQWLYVTKRRRLRGVCRQDQYYWRGQTYAGTGPGKQGTPSTKPVPQEIVKPPAPITQLSPENQKILADMFDGIFVINMRKRLDRLKLFYHRLPLSWPHLIPERIEGYDIPKEAVPDTWTTGRGSYGCMLSHRMALHLSLERKYRRVLVLEDDAEATEDYAYNALQFFNSVPKDWEMLWLGNQNLGNFKKVNDRVIVPEQPHRMHAYAFQGYENIRFALHRLNDCDHHCDFCLGTWSYENLKTYAAMPTLFHQGSNKSDIDGKDYGRRF